MGDKRVLKGEGGVSVKLLLSVIADCAVSLLVFGCGDGGVGESCAVGPGVVVVSGLVGLSFVIGDSGAGGPSQ